MERRRIRRKLVSPVEHSTGNDTRQATKEKRKHAKLERVFGTTACSSSISVDPESGLVAYAAGSIVVVLNPYTLSQAHLISAGKNQLTSLSFSPNGRYIVTGEFGAEPKVRIWELRHEGNTRGEQRAELAYHRLGISCVSFTRDSDQQVISVGNQHDKSVCVWDWRTQTKLAESRLTCQVSAMDVSESGRMFVTVGVRHVKFWYLERSPDQHSSNSVLLQGRSAILADQRNNTFVDVCCAPNNRTFSITISKLLVEFVDKKLTNIYELGGEIPFSLALGSPNLLFMGFGNGAVRAMDLTRMEPEMELPLPHRLHTDIACCLTSSAMSPIPFALSDNYPDVHSLVFHPATSVLTAFYSDRSIYHWHIQQPSASPALSSPAKAHVIKLSSQLFHVGPVFDLEVCESQPGLFLTAGADETVRLWTLSAKSADSSPSPNVDAASTPLPVSALDANPYSMELRKILYLNSSIDSLSEQPDKNFGGILADSLDSTAGVRCLRLSANGEHLACGSRNGNICVFDLSAKEMPKLVELEAHDGEVLCLEYCDPSAVHGQHNLLASGSRDRLIHLFNVDQQYAHMLTIDDHSSSVCALRFNTSDPSSFELVTFGTDKLIVVRQIIAQPDQEGTLCSHRLTQIVASNGPNCMTVTGEGSVLVGCQDRQLRLYSGTGKLARTVKGSVCEEGTITKLCLDPSESFVATICSDRFVYIMDLSNGECVAVLNGQSDCVTGIRFSPDCKRLLLVSYSGCILVWRLSVNLTRRMRAKLAATRNLQDEAAATAANGNRSATPDSLGSDESAARRTDEFGSLTSLNICSSAAATAHENPAAKRRPEDDELDSGIGGGGAANGGGPQLPDQHNKRSTFELKRVVPADTVVRRSASNLNQPQQHEGDEENDPPSVASPPPAPVCSTAMLYQPMHNSHHQPHHRPQGAPPPYHAAMASQQQQQQMHAAMPPVASTGSRSMSNLHSVRGNQQPQQGRRRWGVPPAAEQQQQQRSPNMVPSAGMVYATSPQNAPAAYLSPPHAYQQSQPQQHSSPLAINSPATIYSTQYVSPVQQHHRVPPPQHHLSPQHMQQQPGGGLMSTSVSLNAIRGMLAGGEGATEFAAQQHHLLGAVSPLPFENSQLENGWARNSLSKRYFQNGAEKATVWSPAAPRPVPKHRSSNLFNSSGGAASLFSSLEKAKTVAAATSSSSTATTPTMEVGEGTTPNNGHTRRYQPKTPHSQGSISPERRSNDSHPHKGAKMAMSKLKQRRLSTAREDAASADAAALRSRSQSPTHLALQSLSSLSATPSGTTTSANKSPSSLRETGFSGSPSSVSRSQHRLSSMNTSRLQEARERLKKSQENLAALGQDDHETAGTAGEGASSALPRSRSIGNLRFSLARNGPQSRRSSISAAAALSEQQRQMAKSVNDLAEGELGGAAEGQDDAQQMMGGSRLAQLSASRQRLAQSIRDMRRISNSDLTEPGQYHQTTSVDAHQQQSPTAKMMMARRGVQKKLDRNSQSPRYAESFGAGTESAARPHTVAAAGSPFSAGGGLLSTFVRRASQETPLRSVSSVAAPQQRSNYLATKLARSRAPNSARSPSTSSRQPQQDSSPRSLSIELASAANSLASAAQMVSPGSQKMALHASECIQEMTRACDKLLGTRQLINSDPAIGSEERRHLLIGVNKAIQVFRQRLDAVLTQPMEENTATDESNTTGDGDAE